MCGLRIGETKKLRIGETKKLLNKMIHAGMFVFKKEVSDLEKSEFLKALKGLEVIPGVVNLQVFKQISPKNSFEYYFSMEFLTMQIYDAYSNHPLHNNFVNQYWIPLVADFLEIDTELL